MMTSVSGSASQASMKSTSSRTVLLPSETTSLKPMPSSLAQSSTDVTTAPDWLRNDIVPGRGLIGANVAFRPTAVPMTPRQFGPTRFRS